MWDTVRVVIWGVCCGVFTGPGMSQVLGQQYGQDKELWKDPSESQFPLQVTHVKTPAYVPQQFEQTL